MQLSYPCWDKVAKGVAVDCRYLYRPEEYQGVESQSPADLDCVFLGDDDRGLAGAPKPFDLDL